MQRLRVIASALLSLGILLLGTWGLWLMADGLGSYLRSLDSDVAVAIIAAAATGLVSVITIAITKAYETRATVRQDLRSKKVPVYEDFIRMLFRILFSEKLGQPAISAEEMISLFVQSSEKLTIWGSDELIKTFGDFKTQIVPGSEPLQALSQLEDLMLAIRKDLGHTNKGLARGSILRMFVTDIDQILGR